MQDHLLGFSCICGVFEVQVPVCFLHSLAPCKHLLRCSKMDSRKKAKKDKKDKKKKDSLVILYNYIYIYMKWSLVHPTAYCLLDEIFWFPDNGRSRSEAVWNVFGDVHIKSLGGGFRYFPR